MDAPGTLLAAPLRLAGWVLVAGGMLAIVGAFWPPYRQWSAPLPEALRVIAAHPVGWRCIHAGFASGTVVATFGLALLAYALRGQPGGAHALLTAVAWGLGGSLWLANIAIRLSATRLAADELVVTGAIPTWYAAWKTCNGILFAAFSALAYGAVAGLGWTILRSAIAASWMGWLFVAWGLSAGFVVGASVPFIAYVPFVVLGISLVRGT